MNSKSLGPLPLSAEQLKDEPYWPSHLCCHGHHLLAIWQVIRIVMLVLAWPLLNWWGYVISPQEAVVLSWSGLRGAVGISLALYILLDDQISDLRYRTLTFFHMGCVAFLTIVLQGTTMKPLLQVQSTFLEQKGLIPNQEHCLMEKSPNFNCVE